MKVFCIKEKELKKMSKKLLFKRISAFIVDILFLNIAYFVLLKLIDLFPGSHQNINLMVNPFFLPNQGFTNTSFIVMLILVFLNWVVLPSTEFMGTIGMKIVRVRILDENTGKKIVLTKSLIRYIMSCFSFFLLGLGFIMALFTNKQQTLHDKATHTVVR